MRAKLTFSVILFALVIIFILQNMMIVEIRFFFWTISMSRSLLMFLLLASGFLVGWFLNSYTSHRKEKRKGR